MGIWLPQGIPLSIPGLRARGYKIFSYHGIWVLRFSLLCYLLLCLVIRPDRDINKFSNPVNSIENPVLVQKKGKMMILS